VINEAQIKTKRILVVEDEPHISEICQLIFGDEGFYVDTAENGQTALEILRQTEYDILFVDIKMPLMSGIELYNCLDKELPQLTKSVVFTSGDVMNNDVTAFLAKTNRPFLPKPFTIKELKTIIETAMGKETHDSANKLPMQVA